MLRVFDHLSEARGAQVLNCAIGTVKARSRAMARLREALRWPSSVQTEVQVTGINQAAT